MGESTRSATRERAANEWMPKVRGSFVSENDFSLMKKMKGPASQKTDDDRTGASTNPPRGNHNQACGPPSRSRAPRLFHGDEYSDTPLERAGAAASVVVMNRARGRFPSAAPALPALKPYQRPEHAVTIMQAPAVRGHRVLQNRARPRMIQHSATTRTMAPRCRGEIDRLDRAGVPLMNRRPHNVRERETRELQIVTN